jgi:hypothetical protein
MNNEQQLVPQQRGNSGLERISLRPQEFTLLGELDLCAADSKSEPDARLNTEFLREFAGEEAETIQWAFRQHRRQSQFFPSIAEITALITRRRRELWEAAQVERRRQERAESEKARAEGKFVSFAEILTMIRAAVKRIPDSPALAKWHRLHEAPRRSFTTPPVILTPEEIRASVERERNDPKCQAELEHYREMYGGQE